MYPSLSQFQRWASQYKAVPIWMEPELPNSDVMDWVHALAGSHHKFFFLHSASSGMQSRYSFAALEPPRYSLQCKEGSLTVSYHSESEASIEALKIGNPFDRFYQWLSQWNAPHVEALPPFWGGAVGYLGFESARYFDPKLETIISRAHPKLEFLSTEAFPEFEFSVWDSVVAIDHVRRRLWLIHTLLLPHRKIHSPQQLERLYRSAQDRLRRQAVRLQRALRHERPWGTFEASPVRSNMSQAAYGLMVRRAKGYIAAGDIYQANLSQSLSASWEGDPWVLYRRLAHINPSPYGALWRSGSRWIISQSPELLLRKEADHIETRPIAGTWPRNVHHAEEPHQLKVFKSNAKERAEHVMLVDLERNDLGRVCATSSVHVAESLAVETYSHVYHLVSDIRGQLLQGKTWRDALAACFPGGTITGCPKIRSIEIIRKLEMQPRGPYTGSLGWIGFNGDLTFNILIRSLFLDQGRLRFPVGAGIVADSNSLQEYRETLHKAQAMQQALLTPSVSSPLFFKLNLRRLL